MKAKPDNLLGRTIVAVGMRWKPNGRGGKTCDPILTLDDGRRIWFVVEDAEFGDRGVRIHMGVAMERKAPRRVRT